MITRDSVAAFSQKAGCLANSDPFFLVAQTQQHNEGCEPIRFQNYCCSLRMFKLLNLTVRRSGFASQNGLCEVGLSSDDVLLPRPSNTPHNARWSYPVTFLRGSVGA